ncbi:MAG: hypothetical protein EOP04_24295 [Proteobacteria bacterium]|nr:MAG: hypothetical protein EOP04_24295 [Pseudomonadota bacterium]
MKKYIVIASMLLSFSAASISAPAFAAPAASAPSGKKEVKTTKKAKKKKKSSGKADFSPLNFLPFGVGQFMQGRPLMGAVLGGGQAGMLFLYLDRNSQIDASNKDATATINEIKAKGTTETDTDAQAYLKRNADYVKKTQTEATLCLVGFVGLYGVSVVEAVWDPFGSRKSAEKKAADLQEMEDGAEKWAKQEEFDREQTKGRFSMFALPTMEKANSSYGISFNKSFR